MGLFPLHIPEEHVGGHRLRDKVGRTEQILQGLGGLLPEIQEIFPGGQDAHNVVDVLAVHWEPGQARLADGVQYLILLRVGGEGHHIGSMDHHVLGGDVVKLQDVFNKFLLAALNGARFLALLHHSHDVVLRHLVFSVDQIQNGPPQQLHGVDTQAYNKKHQP